MFLKRSFNATDTAVVVLENEDLMRLNADFLTKYARNLLVFHRSPFAALAYDWYIRQSEGKPPRKDGVTPVRQHEQSHILNADSMIRSAKGKLGWDEQKYGNIDVFFAAIILHDVIEDGGMNGTQLLDHLQFDIEEQYVAKTINRETREQMHKAAHLAVKTVEILSRNHPLPNGKLPNRIEYINRILENPLAVLIKQIDWINKLATMPGVEAFEKDNQDRMKRNLNETFEIFEDRQQGFARRAIKNHPGIRRHVLGLDAEMGIVSFILQGYVNRSADNYEGNPYQEEPYDFSPYIGQTKRATKFVPGGANAIHILHKQRLPQIGKNNPVIQTYNDLIVGKPLLPYFETSITLFVSTVFKKAVGTCIDGNKSPSLNHSEPT